MAGCGCSCSAGPAGWGGTVARLAADEGHEVVALARGSRPAPSGVRLVTADRARPDALDVVAAERWDAVVDVASQPGAVRAAVAALEPVADRYLYVSSRSVYADQGTPGADETAAVLPPLEQAVLADPADYGRAKSACERAVLDAFGPERALVARSGLIGGPGDETGRSTWAHRSRFRRVA